MLTLLDIVDQTPFPYKTVDELAVPEPRTDDFKFHWIVNLRIRLKFIFAHKTCPGNRRRFCLKFTFRVEAVEQTGF